MNSLKIGSLMAIIACSAGAIALGQGCVVSVNDPNYDAGTEYDSSSSTDSGTKDTSTTTDSGTPDSSEQTCGECIATNCSAESNKCATPLADNSNVVTLADDRNVGKTYCVALNRELTACDTKYPNDQAAYNECASGVHSAYDDHNGKTDLAAVEACGAAKCATPCQ